jgi:predicted RNA-binding Zn ribbon-like protein
VTTTRIAQLSLVGGHRAIDLVNTVTPRLPQAAGDDHLLTPEDLLTWSRRTGLVDDAEAAQVAAAWTASPAAGRRALAAATEIREALHEVLSACLDDQRGPAMAHDQLEHLSLAWAAVVPRARLVPAAGGIGVARWAVDSPPALLVADRIALAAIDLLSSMDVTRLARCPVEAGGCGMLFLDHSKNRSRRWCAMEDCGSGAKARRLTERRRDTRAATP